jgi:hypothetical protein
MTRWMRPPELERARRRDSFDPVTAGAAYRLSPKQSLDLWQLVTEAVEQRAGRLDAKFTRSRSPKPVHRDRGKRSMAITETGSSRSLVRPIGAIPLS